ncbi:MAG: 3-deoxy-7-phosphoheptulonate synthase [Fimbriimonadaceae bacterium]|nr:3-deoxy-7-phosphoheptulonate synthase [Fimbriimonadaceae bacterium]
MHRRTDDLRILQTRPLVPPAILHEELPITDAVSENVYVARRAVADVLHGRDRRMVAVVGPCSIHDVDAARAYAERLKGIAERVAGRVVVLMRAYFEKPRTSVGWKGLINDPDLDETFQVNKGLRLARRLLLDVNAMGLPTGSEFLDLQIPQHIADVTAWVAIGARTTESQVHRELASGLSMPVGFKNSTEGNLTPAVDAVQAARSQHWFPSVTKQGVGAIFQTTGNPDCHIILRGGARTGPNYDEDHVARACGLLEKKGLPARVMVDCSHGNSHKDHRRQAEVLDEVCRQLRAGTSGLMGVMIESHLVEGRQDPASGGPLVFGQSVTDACVGIEETEAMLLRLADALA